MLKILGKTSSGFLLWAKQFLFVLLYQPLCIFSCYHETKRPLILSSFQCQKMLKIPALDIIIKIIIYKYTCINKNVIFLAAYTVVLISWPIRIKNSTALWLKEKFIVQLQSCTALILNLAKCLIIKHTSYYIRCKTRVWDQEQPWFEPTRYCIYHNQPRNSVWLWSVSNELFTYSFKGHVW